MALFVGERRDDPATTNDVAQHIKSTNIHQTFPHTIRRATAAYSQAVN